LRRSVSRRAERSTWIDQFVLAEPHARSRDPADAPVRALAGEHREPAAAAGGHAQHARRAELGARAERVQRGRPGSRAALVAQHARGQVAPLGRGPAAARVRAILTSTA
jgi:hypothetical protein